MTRWRIVFSWYYGNKRLRTKGKDYRLDDKGYKRFIISRIVICIGFAIADIAALIPEGFLYGMACFGIIFGAGLFAGFIILPKNFEKHLTEINKGE